MEVSIDIEEIQQYLPHRYPFLLVDRVVQLDLGKYIVPEKNISCKRYSLVVDALFGTGLRGKLNNQVAFVINQINKSEKSIVAVDIPSGLNPLDGSVANNVIKAELTVTFHKSKSGLLQRDKITGEIITVDIGIPPELGNNL